MTIERLQYLLAKAAADLLSPAEEAELDAWYRSYAGEPDLTAQLQPEQLPVVENGMWQPIQAGIEERRRGRVVPLSATGRLRWGRFLRRAAIVLLLLGAAGALGYLFRHPLANLVSPVPQHTVATANGQRKVLQLPDGTRVWLSPGSRLQYPARFREKERSISLEGEAFFEVQPGRRPFVIHSGSCATRVLGTAFNVNAYTGSRQAVVTVVSGKVMVSASHGGEEAPPVIVGASQQAVLDHQTGRLQQLPAPDAADLMATRQGALIFKGVALSSVASQLERQFGARVTLPAHLLSCEYYGRFPAGAALTDILEDICFTLQAAYRETGNHQYVITGGQCAR